VKTRTKVAVSVLAVLAIGISFVTAQSVTASDTVCPHAKTAGTGASCPHSGSTAHGAHAALAGAHAAHAPHAALAGAHEAATAASCPFKAAGIQLTVAQQTEIQAIVAKARQKVLAALTVDQRAKFAPVSISFAIAKLPTATVTTAALTGAATTDACCASKTNQANPTAAIAAQLAANVVTAADATAPAKGACGADCTKPCCAK